jgi:formate hydrogenlyase subunit 6/NADH:ubiquinone oxidoreductase subunit I
LIKMFETVRTILKQLFLNPATNKFPAKYAPASTIQFLNSVTKGELEMIPPVSVPPQFRGKIALDKEGCTGCRLCISVCPTKAIEFIPEEKKVKIFVSRCCFCAQCVDICPPGVLSMTDEFLLANYDKYADELVVVDSGKLQGSVKKKKPTTESAEKPAEQS